MAAQLHSCFDYQRMLMRRMQEQTSRLQIGPTSRTRDSVWFHFPCPEFDTAMSFTQAYSPTHFIYLGQPTSTSLSEENVSVCPEKMFEPNIVQARFCFFATAAPGSDELVIYRDGRFPL